MADSIISRKYRDFDITLRHHEQHRHHRRGDVQELGRCLHECPATGRHVYGREAHGATTQPGPTLRHGATATRPTRRGVRLC